MQKSNIGVWNKDVPGIVFPLPCLTGNKGSIVRAFYSLYWRCLQLHQDSNFNEYVTIFSPVSIKIKAISDRRIERAI